MNVYTNPGKQEDSLDRLTQCCTIVSACNHLQSFKSATVLFQFTCYYKMKTKLVNSWFLNNISWKCMELWVWWSYNKLSIMVKINCNPNWIS